MASPFDQLQEVKPGEQAGVTQGGAFSQLQDVAPPDKSAEAAAAPGFWDSVGNFAGNAVTLGTDVMGLMTGNPQAAERFWTGVADPEVRAGVAREALNEIPLGMGNRLVAKIAGWTGGDQQKTLEEMNAANAAFEAKHPEAALATKIGSLVVPGLGAAKLPFLAARSIPAVAAEAARPLGFMSRVLVPAAKRAAVGAGIGGAEGYGGSEWGDEAGGALRGAGAGATLALGLPVVGSLGRKLIGTTPVQQAQSELARTIAESNLKPSALGGPLSTKQMAGDLAAAGYSTPAGHGEGMMLADLDPRLRSVGVEAAQYGEPRAIAHQELFERGMNEPALTTAATRKGLPVRVPKGQPGAGQMRAGPVVVDPAFAARQGQREATAIETLGAKPTAPLATVPPGPPGGLGPLTRTILGHIPVAGRIAERLGYGAEVDPRINEQIVRMLYSRHPADQQQVLDALRALRVTRGGSTAATGVAAGVGGKRKTAPIVDTAAIMGLHHLPGSSLLERILESGAEEVF